MPSPDAEVAYTKPDHPYPGFINVQRHGDKVTFIIRGDARDGKEGQRANLTIPWSEARRLIRQCLGEN